MIYVVVKHEEGNNIKNLFQSFDLEECSKFLISDFKRYCKEKYIDYMERDLDHPELESKDPSVFDAIYEKYDAVAYNELTMCNCYWDIIEVKE